MKGFSGKNGNGGSGGSGGKNFKETFFYFNKRGCNGFSGANG
jgi:hypothetical protein